MKPGKKNKFFTFIFSFIPGAGEMYMGFMKMGISLMGLSALCTTAMGLFNTGIFAAPLIVIWFYSFFHTHHLSSLSDADFEKVEDSFMYGLKALESEAVDVRKYRKWFAYLLIGLGVLLLWNTAWDLVRTSIRYLSLSESPLGYSLWYIRDAVPQVVLAALVIIAGTKLIRGKKNTLFSEEAAAGQQPEGEKETGGGTADGK